MTDAEIEQLDSTAGRWAKFVSLQRNLPGVERDVLADMVKDGDLDVGRLEEWWSRLAEGAQVEQREGTSPRDGQAGCNEVLSR